MACCNAHRRRRGVVVMRARIFRVGARRAGAAIVDKALLLTPLPTAAPDGAGVSHAARQTAVTNSPPGAADGATATVAALASLVQPASSSGGMVAASLAESVGGGRLHGSGKLPARRRLGEV